MRQASHRHSVSNEYSRRPPPAPDRERRDDEVDGLGLGVNQSRDPEIINGDGALIRGLLRLLTALRAKATVPAVEWEKYEAVFDQTDMEK
jgi:hypothetical protein